MCALKGTVSQFNSNLVDSFISIVSTCNLSLYAANNYVLQMANWHVCMHR